MKQATFFVGVNNDTGKVNVTTITDLVTTYFGAGTITPTIGVWNGEMEKSVTVTVGHKNTRGYIHLFASLLCDVLNQDAVGVGDGQSFEIVEA